MRPTSVLLGLVLVPVLMPAQGTRLLRQPTVSSTQIAFAYAGDIWVVSRDGGDAKRLTSFPGTESDPHFSPDGKQIAFSMQYGGNTDVYVIDAAGGEARRLTRHPAPDIARGWAPDARRVLFSSARVGAPSVGVQQLWTVAAAGGVPERLPIPDGLRGSFSPDGQRVAYEKVSRWDVEWRNYRGGQTHPITLYTIASHAVDTLPWQGTLDTWPVWMGDAIYFISDRDWAANIWKYDVASKQLTQLTHYKDYDVKTLDAGAGVVVYEEAGYLHLLDPATGKDTQLVITCRGDLPWAEPRWVDASKWIESASLSPSGKRALFSARGEVFSVPAEKGDARNLTRSPGTAERTPLWSPDGKQVAWFSDASGEYRLMIGTQEGLGAPREIRFERPTFFHTADWSPDGKYIAVTDEGLNMLLVEVATGKVMRIDTDTYAHPARTFEPAWSPDSKWLAYAKRLPSQFHVLMAYSMTDRKSYQLTDGLSDAVSPSWDAGGKYLYFLASTDFGLSSGWLDLSSYDRHLRRGAYLMVLAADTPSPLLPESDEEARDTTAGPEATKAKSGADTGKQTVRVRIDRMGLSQRILALGMPVRAYTSLAAANEGVVFVSEAIENQPGLTLHRYDLKKRKSESFVSPVTRFSLSRDGKKLLYQSGESWMIVGTDAAPKPGDGKITVDLQMRLDPRAEWRQIFREAWRFERDYLYVPNHNGADWDKVWTMYEPWLASLGHRSDLTYLLDLLGGELSLGHTFVFGGDTPAIDTVKIGMLGVDFAVENGRYRFKRIFSGENWNPNLRAPLSAPGVKARTGDYLLAVNGTDLKPPMSPYEVLEGTANRQTVLRLNDKPTLDGSWTVTVVPVKDEDDLRTRAWVEDNRRLVDSLSRGRLAYVWLPNTADQGYEYFNRYYFAQQDRQGVILDERFNQGGYIADYFVDILARHLRGYFNNPVGERRPWTEPLTGIFGPKVMLINEYAGSGGDMLPYLFHQMRLGPLIGTRTWGGLVGIWDVPGLIDGGYITAPRGGFFDLQGHWDVENVGITPDIVVLQTPALVAQGHDPQLERAVQEALRLLEANPVTLLAEPAPPVRVRRP
ncbi:MAG: protease [Gemmatimonadetes bacterium]|nr:MAG: protease [Gemmatimonadota bacterium]PYO76041.1 MAG: protease [Gemmatimonadota bacterium]TLY52836.1 MAG: protease [Gemmatimonadota bacterium]